MKISLILLVALAATALLRRRSAAVRHWILAAALVCAAATPALERVVPAWEGQLGAWWRASHLEQIDRPLLVLQTSSADSSSAARPSARPFDAARVSRLLGVVWAAGAGVSVFVLLVGLGRLTRLASRATRVVEGRWADVAREIAQAYGLGRPVLILQSDHPTLVVTWGVIRPKVLLPADAQGWPEDRIRIVLGHELAHIRRRDWLVLMVGELLRAAYWFNPLVWITCTRLRLESEHACDDAVLKLGVEGSSYATELVDLARALVAHRTTLSGLPAAAIARPSSLERRVRAMLNVRLNRDPVTRSAGAAAAIALVALTLPLAGFGAAAQTFSTISGNILDPLGRALSGVTLTLTNAQAQSTYQIKSDPTGHYQFIGLPPGTYTLVFEYIGFASLKREGLTLGGGEAVTVNATMQIGSISETITVSGPGGAAPSAPPPPRVNQVPRVEAPDPCAASPAGGCIRPPVKIRDVRPIYPAGASAGSGTVVILSGRIDVNGLVTDLQVLRAPDPAFGAAALEAVIQWEFLPTHLDGQPIETRMLVTVNFIAAQ